MNEVGETAELASEGEGGRTGQGRQKKTNMWWHWAEVEITLRKFYEVSLINCNQLHLLGPSPTHLPETLPTASLLTSVTELTPSTLTLFSHPASPRAPLSPSIWMSLWAPTTDDTYESSILAASPLVQSKTSHLIHLSCSLPPLHTLLRSSQAELIEDSPLSTLPSIVSSSSSSCQQASHLCHHLHPFLLWSTPLCCKSAIHDSGNAVTSSRPTSVTLTRTPFTVCSTFFITMDILEGSISDLEEVSTEPLLLSTQISKAVSFWLTACKVKWHLMLLPRSLMHGHAHSLPCTDMHACTHTCFLKHTCTSICFAVVPMPTPSDWAICVGHRYESWQVQVWMRVTFFPPTGKDLMGGHGVFFLPSSLTPPPPPPLLLTAPSYLCKARSCQPELSACPKSSWFRFEHPWSLSKTLKSLSCKLPPVHLDHAAYASSNSHCKPQPYLFGPLACSYAFEQGVCNSELPSLPFHLP